MEYGVRVRATPRYGQHTYDLVPPRTGTEQQTRVRTVPYRGERAVRAADPGTN